MDIFSGYNKRILTNKQIGYILGENTLVYTSPAAESLYHIENIEQCKEAFKDLNIGAVVLVKGSANHAVSVLPWYKYISAFPFVIINNMEVYFLEW